MVSITLQVNSCKGIDSQRLSYSIPCVSYYVNLNYSAKINIKNKKQKNKQTKLLQNRQTISEGKQNNMHHNIAKYGDMQVNMSYAANNIIIILLFLLIKK